MIYILWSCAQIQEAKTICRSLLEKKWIACASFFPVQSMYSWEESIHEDDEIKVLLKTDKIHFDRIANFIQENCSYDVPEIVAMEATHVNAKYLIWLNATVSK